MLLEERIKRNRFYPKRQNAQQFEPTPLDNRYIRVSIRQPKNNVNTTIMAGFSPCIEHRPEQLEPPEAGQDFKIHTDGPEGITPVKQDRNHYINDLADNRPVFYSRNKDRRTGR
jgi:hypothetical protein